MSLYGISISPEVEVVNFLKASIDNGALDGYGVCRLEMVDSILD